MMKNISGLVLLVLLIGCKVSNELKNPPDVNKKINSDLTCARLSVANSLAATYYPLGNGNFSKCCQNMAEGMSSSILSKYPSKMGKMSTAEIAKEFISMANGNYCVYPRDPNERLIAEIGNMLKEGTEIILIIKGVVTPQNPRPDRHALNLWKITVRNNKMSVKLTDSNSAYNFDKSERFYQIKKGVNGTRNENKYFLIDYPRKGRNAEIVSVITLVDNKESSCISSKNYEIVHITGNGIQAPSQFQEQILQKQVGSANGSFQLKSLDFRKPNFNPELFQVNRSTYLKYSRFYNVNVNDNFVLDKNNNPLQLTNIEIKFSTLTNQILNLYKGYLVINYKDDIGSVFRLVEIPKGHNISTVQLISKDVNNSGNFNIGYSDDFLSVNELLNFKNWIHKNKSLTSGKNFNSLTLTFNTKTLPELPIE